MIYLPTISDQQHHQEVEEAEQGKDDRNCSDGDDSEEDYI